MRSKSWAYNVDRQATVDEYIRAYRTGAKDLADRIEEANSGDNLAPEWAPIDFKALQTALNKQLI